MLYVPCYTSWCIIHKSMHLTTTKLQKSLTYSKHLLTQDCILSNHKWNKICCRYECNINMINYGLVLTVSKQLSYSQLNDQWNSTLSTQYLYLIVDVKDTSILQMHAMYGLYIYVYILRYTLTALYH